MTNRERAEAVFAEENGMEHNVKDCPTCQDKIGRLERHFQAHAEEAAHAAALEEHKRYCNERIPLAEEMKTAHDFKPHLCGCTCGCNSKCPHRVELEAAST